MTQAKTLKTLTTLARTTVAALFADAATEPFRIARRGNVRRAIAYIPAGHVAYARFAGEPKPLKAGEMACGLILVEWLEPHQDALSVSGVYLVPSDEMAPAHKCLWVMAKADGAPDVDYLTRDGGALSRAMNQLW